MEIKRILLVSMVVGWVYSQAFLKGQQERDNFDEHAVRHRHGHNYDSSEKLEIHLIPHSHDDVGWLKSVDQYYYGSRNDIQLAGVQYTIDGVVTELLKDPKKTFVYVEMAFFYRWYKNQDKAKKEQVQKLVDDGQLEFINGGVCMNDEAAPYYEDMIDQMTWGHQFLKREFNVVPTIGWQIDPFGHSATQARLFYDMGFDGWFFARVDHQDKDRRLNERALEHIVNPVSDAKQNKPIFTGVLYRHYESPPGFGFDVGQRDEPIMDDPTLEYYNLESKAQDFINYFRDMQKHYKQNVLIHTMGSDFQYMDAKMNFMNMDKLVHYLSKEENMIKYNVEVVYSTVSRYLKRINELNITSYETKNDDFFPYASDVSDYWTGYFTSRVNSKYLIKETGRFLQTVRSLFTHMDMSQQMDNSTKQVYKKALFDLEHMMGIVQHHDAVSGTEREAVNGDYSRILTKARDEVYQLLLNLFKKEANSTLDLSNMDLNICRWNQTASECGAVQGDNDVLMAVQYPMTTIESVGVMQVKVPSDGWEAIALSSNTTVQSETICGDHYDTTNCVLYVYSQRKNGQLDFFKLARTATEQVQSIHMEDETLIVENGVKIQATNFMDFNISSDHTEQAFSFSLDYRFYKSYQGDGHKSGAYAFRPDISRAEAGAYSMFDSGNVYMGKYTTVIELYSTKVTNIFQKFFWRENDKESNRILTTLRFYHGATSQGRYNLADAIEVDTFVNSIDVSDHQGKEIIMRVTGKDISNQGVFYTDSNGLEMQKRTLNHRDTWEWDRDEYVTGNYYPVNAIIGAEDIKNGNSLYLLNDRSQGGSVLNDGAIEVMIHRRGLYDDNKGVCEPLNEKDPDGKGMRAHMRHYIVNTMAHARKQQFWMDQADVMALGQASFNSMMVKKEQKVRGHAFGGQNQFLKHYLMPNYDQDDSFFVRVQNMDPELKELVLEGVEQSREMSLTTVMDKETMEDRRMHWNYQPSYPDQDTVSLGQLEIKTFEVTRPSF